MGARKVESDLRKILKMHKLMVAADLTMSTSGKLGAFFDENILRDTLKQGGRQRDAIGRVISRHLVRGIP